MTLDSTCVEARGMVCARMLPEAVFAVILVIGAVTTAQAASSSSPGLGHGPAQAASAVPTDVHARPTFGPLQAGQIQQIQSVGRSVLAAKHSQQPSSEELALVGELHALSSEIDQSILPHDGKVELQPASASNGQQQSRAAHAAKTDDEDIRNRLQPHLTRLHERRAALNDAVAPVQPEAREIYQGRMQQLNDRVAEIEQAVQSTMALPEAERRAKLAELSHRLKPRTQDELLQEQHSDDVTDHSTPTLTTLTQHRIGLAGKGPDAKSIAHPAYTSQSGKPPAKH